MWPGTSGWPATTSGPATRWRRCGQAVIDVIPMHALGTPDDVAEAVRYLVSDEAHDLTGALIPVAGGLLMM
jgi:NAD(P)-dependent dehydrogenase (short-subunit alcohol dehydrogenase family)